jgi:hypothetical protein
MGGGRVAGVGEGEMGREGGVCVRVCACEYVK